MGLVQLLPEADSLYTPVRKKARTVDIRVSQAASRFGEIVVPALRCWVSDKIEFWGRCKRAAILADWLEGVSIQEIETEILRILRRTSPIERYHAVCGCHPFPLALGPGTFAGPDRSFPIQSLTHVTASWARFTITWFSANFKVNASLKVILVAMSGYPR